MNAASVTPGIGRRARQNQQPKQRELRYIHDPSDVMSDDYPSESFRVLKNNELSNFCEYRTRRLVLEALGQT